MTRSRISCSPLPMGRWRKKSTVISMKFVIRRRARTLSWLKSTTLRRRWSFNHKTSSPIADTREQALEEHRTKPYYKQGFQGLVKPAELKMHAEANRGICCEKHLRNVTPTANGHTALHRLSSVQSEGILKQSLTGEWQASFFPHHLTA